MQIILYLSIAVIAIAFLILVIYLSKTLKSLQVTLDSVSKTLVGLEKQLDGVTRETTELLHKTNALAEDIQHKSKSLNSVVVAVKDVGDTVRSFNGSIQKVTTSVNSQFEENKDKIAAVVQWSQIFLEMKDKWKMRKQNEKSIVEAEQVLQKKRVRGRN
ncbi:DUF948 domain-containing protein [Cytobacillus solani]|uniref:DUF948 domain-containing protein n=1 Tax=Cytobacillus solani TaxID=1637975 RepID=UPI0006AB982E|nr:DUF948 domain-containing protein [Cytobacillus solani]KOP83767.1 general stress protein [Bacillus sp. FJAT-21945]USK54083.1 DUF948 domain-containing protein [Cytobacillus solani]